MTLLYKLWEGVICLFMHLCRRRHHIFALSFNCTGWWEHTTPLRYFQFSGLARVKKKGQSVNFGVTDPMLSSGHPEKQKEADKKHRGLANKSGSMNDFATLLSVFQSCKSRYSTEYITAARWTCTIYCCLYKWMTVSHLYYHSCHKCGPFSCILQWQAFCMV